MVWLLLNHTREKLRGSHPVRAVSNDFDTSVQNKRNDLRNRLVDTGVAREGPWQGYVIWMQLQELQNVDIGAVLQRNAQAESPGLPFLVVFLQNIKIRQCVTFFYLKNLLHCWTIDGIPIAIKNVLNLGVGPHFTWQRPQHVRIR